MFLLKEVVLPKSLSSSYRPESIGLGNDLLLHFDEMVCAAAWLTWSVYIYLLSDPGEKSGSRWVTLIGRGFGAWTIAGPAGATVLCLWARDEMVLNDRSVHEKKVQ